jgi:ribosomal protein S18 acetylase RimI-like enzyme
MSRAMDKHVMRMRLAVPADVAIIAQWREDSARWLATKGTDQWSDAGLTRTEFNNRVLQSIKEAGTWIFEGVDAVPLGTIAIDDHEDDPGLWEPEILMESVVIHRMIVSRQAAGRGIGAFMLDHAETLARSAGKKWLVLDAWSNNVGLHNYYRSQGFTYLKTIKNHSTASAALFARPVA